MARLGVGGKMKFLVVLVVVFLSNPAAMIRGSTRIVLELATQIHILKRMRLKKRFERLAGNIPEFL